MRYLPFLDFWLTSYFFIAQNDNLTNLINTSVQEGIAVADVNANTKLNAHKLSADHDNRYYTKSQSDAIKSVSINFAGVTNVSLVGRVNGKTGMLNGLVKATAQIGVGTSNLVGITNYKPIITTYFLFWIDGIGASYGYIETNGSIYFSIPSTVAKDTHFRLNIPYVVA